MYVKSIKFFLLYNRFSRHFFSQKRDERPSIFNYTAGISANINETKKEKITFNPKEYLFFQEKKRRNRRETKEKE